MSLIDRIEGFFEDVVETAIARGEAGVATESDYKRLERVYEILRKYESTKETLDDEYAQLTDEELYDAIRSPARSKASNS